MNSTFLITVIIAVIVVAFFVVGLSITLIVKGRNLQSEVGENDEMKKRGLKCASDEFRREEAALKGGECDTGIDCGGSCGSCGEHPDKKA